LGSVFSSDPIAFNATVSDLDVNAVFVGFPEGSVNRSSKFTSFEHVVRRAGSLGACWASAGVTDDTQAIPMMRPTRNNFRNREFPITHLRFGRAANSRPPCSVVSNLLARFCCASLRSSSGVAPDLQELGGGDVNRTPERLNREGSDAARCCSSPVEISSATTLRHRLNRAGDRHANAAWWTIVMVRLRSKHAPTVSYIEPRTTAGLSKRAAIRCLKRYLAREIYNDIRAVITTYNNMVIEPQIAA
jgi:hypothetical protein